MDDPLLTDRGLLWVAGIHEADDLEELMGPHSERLTPNDALQMVPALREDWLSGAILEKDAADIDVAALHQSFVRKARKNGATHRGRGWRDRHRIELIWLDGHHHRRLTRL